MAVENSSIIGQIWLNGSDDFQQRIPQPTQGRIEETLNALKDGNNQREWNYFQSELFNLVGNMIVTDKEWFNPFSVFKRSGLMEQGQDIAEVALDYVEAKGWDYRNDNLFKLHPQKVYERIHRLNRADMYPLSLDPSEMAKAFLSPTGLNDFVNRKIGKLAQSDEYDEYQIVKKLFAKAYNDGSFHNVQVNIADPLAPTADELKSFSAKLRTMVRKVGASPSGRYNSAGVPTVTKPDEFVVITTPEFMSNLEVSVLADAFNQDMTNIKESVIIIDEMPIEGVYALLVDKAFFVMADYVRSLESFYNPKNRVQNLYLHHQGVYSYSPFVNAISFSKEDTSAITEVVVGAPTLSASFVGEEDVAKTTFDYKDEEGTFLLVEATGTVSPETEGVQAPDAFTVSDVTITDSEGEVKKKTSRTFVDRVGQLYVQKGLTAGDVITVSVNSSYFNPSDSSDTSTSSATATVTVA